MESHSHRPRVWLWSAVGLLLVVHAGLLAWIDVRNSPSPDELGQVVAGLSHWELGRFDLYAVNPPLPRMLATLPLRAFPVKTDWSRADSNPFLRWEFSLGSRLARDNGSRTFWYFTIARWALIPFSVLGAFVCYRWGAELYGDRAGLVALLLWVVSPNILGNAAMVMPDVPAAACGVLAGYLFWRWLKDPKWTRALGAGAALGVCELTKTTWVIFFLLWPALWIFWRVTHRAATATRSTNGQDRLPSALQLAAILLCGLYLIHLGYGFEGSFKPLGRYEFTSRLLSGEEREKSLGNRFAATPVGRLPVPFPVNYVKGIDVQRRDFEEGKWSYLAGRQKFRGWWYWYLYALAVKAPLGTWLLCGLALVAWCRPSLATAGVASGASDLVNGTATNASTWHDEVVLLAPAAFLFILVSSETGFSRYLRYALPAFPFIYVWAGRSARFLSKRHTWLGAAVGISLTWLVASSLFSYPHSLSYFNEAAGGPLNGPSHLLDANVDWEQDLLFFKEWYDAHPADRPLFVKFYGYVKPEAAGIDSRPLPALDADSRSRGARPITSLTPGFYAVSANILLAYRHDGSERDLYGYLRKFAPIARAGYSISIYHLERPEIDDIRQQGGEAPTQPPDVR